MNEPTTHFHQLRQPLSESCDAEAPSAGSPVPVGDVIIRREQSGYGIFNYRGERVLELPVRTSGEAARLAAEIVAPWHGRVRMDDPCTD